MPDDTIAAFRALLARQVGGDQVQQNCSFRRMATPVMTGVVLYQLNAGALQASEPALHAQFISDMDDDHWFGCVIRPNTDTNSDMLLDQAHLHGAKGTYESLWSSGRAA